MGIPLLQKTINKLGQLKQVSYVYNHKHIVVDMNNQIYKILQLHRKTLTPIKKFELICDYCQKLINISFQRGIKFYIVLDQMTQFSQYFEYSFDKEYSFLKPYSVKISNGFLQVYKEDSVQDLCNEKGCDQKQYDQEQNPYSNLHAINMFSKINYIKPLLEKKVIKNKKDAVDLKQEIQNGGAVKNDNFSFLLASKYNYYLYETMFNNVPNIEIHVANTEADFKIAQIVKSLIEKGVPPSDICIHSQDSDLLVLQTGVDIQQNIFLLNRSNNISKQLKYYYLHSSDYVLKTEFSKTITQELISPTTEEERQRILRKACETRNLNILIADILFQHFDILESVQQYASIKKEDIKDIQHIKLIFQIYEQCQFNTCFQHIESVKQNIQQNFYFQEVMEDKWVNIKLSQKEVLLKMYFQNQISYNTLVKRLKAIEEADIEKRTIQEQQISD